jgi:16S rRNA (adenine1518-N6/adenine1519-N6)-dimethyltransferase
VSEPKRDLDPRTLLAYYGIRPRKGLGQHFLAASEPVARIIEAAELGPEDTVLEVGPGLGVLSHDLSRHAGKVIAVELDPLMRQVLADQLGHRENLHVVDADILSVDPAELLGYGPEVQGRQLQYKVVANLPYQITSAVLRHVFEARVQPELAVVMVQREVADRILAEPGRMSILAVAMQLYARPSRVTEVPAALFHPPPKVDSTVLRMDVYERPPVDIDNREDFFRVVRAGFSQKRKQLKNSLAAGLDLESAPVLAALEAAGVEARRRAETLSLEEWAGLTRAFGPLGDGEAEAPQARSRRRSRAGEEG